MSDKWDVLGVIGLAATSIENCGGKATVLREALAAVKELVEADRGYDAARDAYHRTWPPEKSVKAAKDLVLASARRDAALARFGGES